jgi:Putative mono-oxygenase ydhR
MIEGRRPTMHVSLFEYGITGIDEASWAMACTEMAPGFTQAPGLVSKIWLKGAAGEFGGVYLWDSVDAYEDFLDSALVAMLTVHPNIDNLTMRAWSVDSALTAITIGVLQP